MISAEQLNDITERHRATICAREGHSFRQLRERGCDTRRATLTCWWLRRQTCPRGSVFLQSVPFLADFPAAFDVFWKTPEDTIGGGTWSIMSYTSRRSMGGSFMNDETQQAVRQWLARAEVDWKTVEVLAAHSDGPRESIAYHCQQYVEKLLKAFLTAHSIEAPRTHDVRRLVPLATPAAPELAGLEGPADILTEYAVAVRVFPTDGANSTTKKLARQSRLRGRLRICCCRKSYKAQATGP